MTSKKQTERHRKPRHHAEIAAIRRKQRALMRQKVRHHTKMALVPNQKNQYRPHLIRRYGLACVLVLVCTLLGSYNLITTGSVLGDRMAITSQSLLEDTNEVRSAHGMQSLELSDGLARAAQFKVNDMFRQQYWAHVAPDGTQPWQWLDEVGYAYVDAGENLAKNFTSSQSIVAAWLNSPTHRENVLGQSYTQVGFSTREGMLDGRQAQITVALYAKPVTETAIAGASTTGEHFTKAPTTQLSLMARVGYTLQSMSPAVLASFLLMLLTAFVAFMAHAYRKKLPIELKRSWYRHHGLYKGVGMTVLVVMVITLYSGGQI